MPDPTVSEMLGAAAALLLRPPSASILAALAESDGAKLDLTEARQDFYDVLCVPQSGRYIPPFAHVLAQAKVRSDGLWNFPPPRFDGGDVLQPWYETAGFDPMRLDADPLLRGPHRPLDQVGFIVAYLAGLVRSRETGVIDDDVAADAVVLTFMVEHVGTAIGRFCGLLHDCGSPYLRAVAEALSEAIGTVREYPAASLAACP